MEIRALGRTGLKVSALSFGGSSLGGVFRRVDQEECVRTVRVALDLGINFIDTAPYYGSTAAETVLGKALQGVPRETYILATKVGQYGEGIFDFSATRVRQSLDESCGRLGVDYVDLLQCHDVESADVDQLVHETLPAMADLRTRGRVGHIGITGLPLTALRSIVERTDPALIDSVLSFCRYTLSDTALETLLPLLVEHGVAVINASPTGMGLLTERGVPPWHPAPAALVAGTRKAVDYCKSVGVDIVKLALQYSIANPRISTTLVGSANPDNMRRNIAYADEPIDEDLLAKVLEIMQPVHNHNFTRGRPEHRDAIVS